MVPNLPQIYRKFTPPINGRFNEATHVDIVLVPAVFDCDSAALHTLFSLDKQLYLRELKLLFLR